MQNLAKSLLIHLLSLQLIVSSSFDYSYFSKQRRPSSIDHTYSLEVLNEKLLQFKTKVKGKELSPDCGPGADSEQDLFAIFNSKDSDNDSTLSREDRAFFKYIDSIGGVSYEKSDNQTRRYSRRGVRGSRACESFIKPATQEAEKCPAKKTKGFIDVQVEKIIKREKENKEALPFRLDDPQVKKIYNNATSLKQEVRKYLYDEGIDIEKRRDLLVNYLGGVALPMRDLIVVMRGYIKDEYDGRYFYESLLPVVNSEIIGEEGSQDRVNITSGLNLKKENFHLKVIDKGWGRIELQYDEYEAIKRDIVQLLRAPTTKNYIRATKWMTFNMMLGQIKLYGAMTGDNSPINIPKSCQNHFNGSLSNNLEMDYTSERGDKYLVDLLIANSLIYEPGDTKFVSYYLDNVDNDPTKEGYSGLMPFENYKSAANGVDVKSGWENTMDFIKSPFVGSKIKRNQFTKPMLDDFQHFQESKRHVIFKSENVFYHRNSYLFGLIDVNDTKYFGAELVEKIFTPLEDNKIYSFKENDGNVVQINNRQNLSVFLAELMQRHKVESWEDLITEKLKAQMKKRPVFIPFPSLYGPVVWRSWALGQLEKFAHKYSKASEVPAETKNVIKMVMRQGKHWVSSGKNIQEHLDNLKKYLKELKVSYDFLPLVRLRTEEHIDGYEVLGNLYSYLGSRTNEIPESKTNEYDYLESQMYNFNPWASVRLSYLLLVDELESISKNEIPKYSNVDSTEFNEEEVNSCKERNVSVTLEKVKKAGVRMGLNKTLRPHYASYLLNKNEEKLIWSEILENFDILLRQKNENGEEVYKDLENVGYQTFLSQNDVSDFVRKDTPEGLSNETWDEIENFFEKPEAKIGTFYSELYKLKGDPKAQLDYFESQSQNFGVDNQYSVKLGFLNMDNIIKRSILKNLLRNVVKKRKVLIYDKLHKLCELEPDSHEDLQTLFYATSKAQNEINGLLGAPSIPQEVMDKIHGKVNEMNSEERRDMWIAFGSAGLAMAALLIGGACTVATGGLCAVAGASMLVAGGAATGLQAWLVPREMQRKFSADKNQAYVKKMEELGFSSKDSNLKVSRSWFWTIFEAISIIPLLGITAKSFNVGSKVTVMSSAILARNIGKKGLKEAWRMSGKAGKTIVAEGDINYARVILGFDSIKDLPPKVIKELKNFSGSSRDAVNNLLKNRLSKDAISKAYKRINTLRKLRTEGKLSAYAFAKRVNQVIDGLKKLALKASAEGFEYTSKVAVTETPEAIDRQTAKVLADYFAGNPRGFENLMGNYANKVPEALDRMKDIPYIFPKKTTFLGKMTIIPWVANGLRHFFYSHIAKHSDNILRIHKELKGLLNRKGVLEDYIFKNMDDLTDIFMEIPVRKREVPYMILVQGGPHLGKSISSIGPRFGGNLLRLYNHSNGIVVKKYFTARSNLIYESMKARARQTLGLKSYISSESAFESYKAFQKSVARTTDNLADDAKDQFLKKYMDLENELSQQVFTSITEDAGIDGNWSKLRNTIGKSKSRFPEELDNLNVDTIKRLLFHASTEQEKALGNILWSSLPVEKLFGVDEMGEVAHRVIRELSDYNSVDEFQDFVNALKVLIIKRDPGVIEIM